VDALQRQDAAEALKRHFNIDVDWRTTPLDRLIDMRVRAAKAAELQERLGVTVDWHLTAGFELERSGGRCSASSSTAARGRRRGRRASPSGAAAGRRRRRLVQPTFKGRPVPGRWRSTDPDGIIRPTFSGRPEPSASARAIRTASSGRPLRPGRAGPSGSVDPDGLIAPTFRRPAVRADRRRRRPDAPDAAAHDAPHGDAGASPPGGRTRSQGPARRTIRSEPGERPPAKSPRDGR
jgi:hypothetical protein